MIGRRFTCGFAFALACTVVYSRVPPCARLQFYYLQGDDPGALVHDPSFREATGLHADEVTFGDWADAAYWRWNLATRAMAGFVAHMVRRSNYVRRIGVCVYACACLEFLSVCLFVLDVAEKVLTSAMTTSTDTNGADGSKTCREQRWMSSTLAVRRKASDYLPRRAVGCCR